MALLVVLAWGLPACRSSQASIQTPGPVAVRVAEVTVAPLRQGMRYVGTVRFAREIVVRAQLPGALVDLPAEEGSLVERGAVVARIDAPDVGARVARVRSELRRAEAEHAHACSVYARDRRLYEADAIPKASLDASRKACEVGREVGAAAQAQLAELRAVHGRAIEHAPSGGLVLEWRAEPGENVNPGQPLLTIGSGALEIDVPVAEDDLRRSIAADTPVEIAFEGRWQAARVARIAPIARGAGRTVSVRVVLPEAAGGRIRAGMSVDVRFVTARAEGRSTVPSVALRTTPDGSAVFVIDDGRARRRLVSPGIAADGRVAIDLPLEPGTLVATSNVDQLSDGQRVYAVRAGAEP